MVRRAYAQRSVFEVLLPDGDKLWDPVLQQIDVILEDEPLVDLIVDRLARRHPLSRRRGRLGTPATVVLRMLVLKHLRHWSFDECEREVRGSLVYRAFCWIGCERVPDAKTLLRLAHLIDPEVLRQLLERLVTLGRQGRVIHGHRLRVDTTVVETRAHYPTDSSLLEDGVRIMTRTMVRLRKRVGADVVRFRDRTRGLARRAFAISQRSRAATLRSPATVRSENKARMTALYQEAMRVARAVVRDADRVATVVTPAPRGPLASLRERLQQTGQLVRG